MSWFLVTLLSAGITALAVYYLCRFADRLGLVDEPNHRSLHDRRTPSSGGIGILAGILAGWTASAAMGSSPPHFLLLFAALTAVATISLFDDIREASPPLRLSVHLAVSAVPVLGDFAIRKISLPGLAVESGVVMGVALTILFITWFINLFNFMDGMDGLAGGMTLLGFAAWAALGAMAGEIGFALASGAVAAAAGGFLVFNFPPARIFMGDVGSAPIGFLVGTFAVWAESANAVPLWTSVMIFSPFVLDATVTLFGRLIRFERIWAAHQTHYYQRSVLAGWSHRRTLTIEYVLMSGCGATGVLTAKATPIIQWTAVGIWLLVYGVCAASVHMRERKERLHAVPVNEA